MERSPSKAENLDDLSSFKGQMAARYKERQSMEIHATLSEMEREKDRENIENENEDESTSTERQDGVGGGNDLDVDPIPPLSVHGTGDDGKQKEKGTEDSTVAPEARLSLKDLITQFEKRSSNTDVESPKSERRELAPDRSGEGVADKRCLAREAWRGSNRVLHMDLDATAVTSSSSNLSVTEDSALAGLDLHASGVRSKAKRIAQRRKPKGKPTGGLRSESSINLELESSRPLGKSAGQEKGERGQTEIGGVSNSNEAPEKKDTYAKESIPIPENCVKVSQPTHGETESSKREDVRANKTIIEKKVEAQLHERRGGIMETEYKNRNGEIIYTNADTQQQLDEQETIAPQPLRINLKDFAARKKRSSNSGDMKYVVHRKDWKKWMQNHPGPSGARQKQKSGSNSPDGSFLRPGPSQITRSSAVDLGFLRKTENMQDISLADNSVGSGGSAGAGLPRRPLTSASNTQHRLRRRHSHKHLRSPSSGNAVPGVVAGGLLNRPESVLKKHGGAMERYLMFLNKTSQMGAPNATMAETAESSGIKRRSPSESMLTRLSSEGSKAGLKTGHGAQTANDSQGSSLPTTPLLRRRNDSSQQALQAFLRRAQDSERKPRVNLGGVTFDATDSMNITSLISPSSGSFVSNTNTLSTLEIEKQTERALAYHEEVNTSKTSASEVCTFAVAEELAVKKYIQNPSQELQQSSAHNGTRRGEGKTAVIPSKGANLNFSPSQQRNGRATSRENGKTSCGPNLITARRAMRSITPSGVNTDRAAGQHKNLSVSPRARYSIESEQDVGPVDRSRSSPATLKRTKHPSPTKAARERDDRASLLKRQSTNEMTSLSKKTLYDNDRRNFTSRAGQVAHAVQSPQMSMDSANMYQLWSSKETPQNGTNHPSTANLSEYKKHVKDGRHLCSTKSPERRSYLAAQLTDALCLDSKQLYGKSNNDALGQKSGLAVSDILRHSKIVSGSSPELANIKNTLRQQLNTMDLMGNFRPGQDALQLNSLLDTTSTFSTLSVGASLAVSGQAEDVKTFSTESGAGKRQILTRTCLEATHPKSTSNIRKLTAAGSQAAKSMSTHAANWQKSSGPPTIHQGSKNLRGILHSQRLSTAMRDQALPQQRHHQFHHHQVQQQQQQQQQQQRQQPQQQKSTRIQSAIGDMTDPTNERENLALHPYHKFAVVEDEDRPKLTAKVPVPPPFRAATPAPRQQASSKESPDGLRLSRELQHQTTNRLQARGLQTKTPNAISSLTSVFSRDRRRRSGPTTSTMNDEVPKTKRQGEPNRDLVTPTSGPSRKKTLSSASRLDQSRRKTVTPSVAASDKQSEVSGTTYDVSLPAAGDNKTDSLSRHKFSNPQDCAEQKKKALQNEEEGKLAQEPNSPQETFSRETSGIRAEGKEVAIVAKWKEESDIDDKTSCHFGRNPASDGTQDMGEGEEEEEGDNKAESSSPEGSPLKRKRKLVNKIKKIKRKRKKKRNDQSVEEESKRDISPNEKTSRGKGGTGDSLTDRRHKDAEIDDKSKDEISIKRNAAGSSPLLKGTKKVTKELSFAASVATSRKESPEVSQHTAVTSVTIRRRARSRSPPRSDASHSTKLPKYRPVRRVSNRPGAKFMCVTHIPTRAEDDFFPTPRKRADVLAMYRRWREGMVDTDKPSKIPLSLGFRWTLDSAVVEEWALHCWSPDSGIYMDEEGAWWSSVSDPTKDGVTQHTSPLAGSKSLSMDGLLELNSRLPNMKWGPLRMLHACYVACGAMCLLVGHVFSRLYSCGGDDFDFFCGTDDVDCLIHLAKMRADWTDADHSLA